jgi:hypothetical protein
MRRQLMQVRPGARLSARLEPDPLGPPKWTSQTPDRVTALLTRIDGLIGIQEAN